MQLVHERRLRPADKLHQPWATRVTGQMGMPSGCSMRRWPAVRPGRPTVSMPEFRAAAHGEGTYPLRG